MWSRWLHMHSADKFKVTCIIANNVADISVFYAMALSKDVADVSA